ncbi:hypothetical protein AYJ54_12350 [Bradyrhizobium centrolobii]|uniref:Uncharacterized protein n=1 Tax=Bradyrhizobium centrolobii TaxID=1505087 RepID=A0A176YQQ7_9BRAD|nr:hypothetical protein [Bradyrhizobium centrolobii]OAF09972.1 hypothetical protein AYJ54_12350 [Bradyrhizobium centrolobii]
MARPGKSVADGQHWVYRLEGRRKCWFQAAEGTATVKKLVQRRAAKHRAAAAEENKTAARKRKAVVDARAELQRSTPVDTSRPGPPAPALVADAGPVLATVSAPLVSPARPPNRANDRLTPDRITPPQVDVEALLAAAPAASDVDNTSAPSTTPGAFPIAEVGDDGQGWTWLGMLLMALGLVSVLSACRTIPWAVLLHQLR